MLSLLLFRITRRPLIIIRRSFRTTNKVQVFNPLLPFDVLDEVQNDDLEEKNEKLREEKKKLMKKSRRMLKKRREKGKGDQGKGSETEGKDNKGSRDLVQKDGELYKTSNDTIPIKKAVSPEVNVVGLEQEEKNDSDVKGTEIKSNDKNQNSQTKDENNSDTLAAGSSATMGPGGGGSGNGNGGDNNNKPPADDSESKDPKDEDSKDNEKKETEEETKKKDKEEEDDLEEELHDDDEKEPKKSTIKQYFERFGKFLFKCLETMGITFTSVGILGFAGLLYHTIYNVHALDKIDSAFENGDPAFQLLMHKRKSINPEEECDGNDLNQFWVERPQQKLVDDIISGRIIGRYFLVIGEKGTGKTSLLLESMRKINGYNVAIFDAHADPEIFRIRLGKALNYTYSEDYIGSLFSMRGPRDTTALLDIERAFGKLEELAIRRTTKVDRPLVLIINNAHLIKENEEGMKLLELLQQKAENLSGSGLVTMIFNSDDYWVYEKLKKVGTRLELVNVRDFNRSETIKALNYIREKHFPSHSHPDLSLDDKTSHNIYDLIGGRPQHISQVARHKDIIRACNEIIDREKTWFLNQCGLLGSSMDDDVIESGKFATSAMLLMNEFVHMDRTRLSNLIDKGEEDEDDYKMDHQLPELPLWRSRQIMTRADYIRQYDNLNIFTIDSDSRVRADSVPMMRAFHEIASQPHFEDLLQDTMDRVADIESLGRTRELVAKDLGLGSTFTFSKKDSSYRLALQKSERQKRMEGDNEDSYKCNDNDYTDDIIENSNKNSDNDTYKLDDISLQDTRKWWKLRMQRFDQSYLPPLQRDRNDIDINRTPR
ncbi:uncharacterized protein PRCAT00000397001 [Priceomyces carsonii]|uniref:uncharacterized protein n=1 Tax=Priceomyces carsonii TaxID=28549 RepID=UPI002ED7AB39|nr:unnamed protein product [Priceomyces carsonii]